MASVVRFILRHGALLAMLTLTALVLIAAMLCDVLITPAWATFLRLWETSDAVEGP